MSTILLIDDNQSVRTSLKILLEGDGHTIEEAADGNTGLRICAQKPIALVITVILLPIGSSTDKDGYEVITELKEKFPDIGLIAVCDRPSHIFVAQAMGIDFFTQTTGNDEVLSTIRKLLAHRSKSSRKFD